MTYGGVAVVSGIICVDIEHCRAWDRRGRIDPSQILMHTRLAARARVEDDDEYSPR
jgi:hypothetical protein